MSLADQILQYVLTGITVGSIYAMVALGFNIIYNSTGIINFAQGEFVMLGGMIMVFFSMALKLPLAIGFAGSVILVTLLGVLLERLTIHPLRNPDVITLIIITLAASILFKGGAMFIWGKEAVTLRPFSGDHPIFIFGATILPQTLWILGITLAVVVALGLFFEFTVFGKAMRACAVNRMAASLMGINVKQMVMVSFALSAALGAVAGIIITPISLMEYDKGAIMGLKGFGAAVLGGLGSGTGAVLAGFILGILESLGAGLIHSGFKDAIALFVLLMVLFFRPSGLMGGREAGKLKKF
ncbi:MAG: branched-chain amino acid ABC transporter permease [Deltaproteobacteria bacterium]|nr:branched-chain amino acid ABC transporter permease [Deltaproteobacteria bacterium]